MEENEKNEIKSSDKNNSQFFRPNPSFLEQTYKTQKEDDTTYGGIPLNELLNRKKRMVDEDQDMSYAATLIAEIKAKNLKRNKKIKLILLISVGAFLLTLILLAIFVPQLIEIIKL